MTDLLERLRSAHILKPNGKLNSNWRRMATPELRVAIDSEFQRLSVDTLSQVVWCLTNSRLRPKCPSCGNNTRFLSYGWYRTYCSAKCAAINDNTKDKRAKTNIKRYGVENVMQASVVRDRQAAASHKSFTGRMFTAIDSMFETKIELLNSVDKFNFTCVKCGTTAPWRVFANRVPRCYKCQPHAQSKIHVQIQQLLDELGVQYVEHNREIIKPLEVDFYIEDLQLAIEVNGIYWHSSENGHPTDHHQYKTLRCLEQNITLIHLFEDDIIMNLDAIKRRLQKNYFQATKEDIKITGILEVDGCWPLPQWFSAKICGVTEPRLHSINSEFSKQPLTIYDSGTLLYEAC